MRDRTLRTATTLLVVSSFSFLLACNSQPVLDAQSGQCPQERQTDMASAAIASQKNPLTPDSKNLLAGKTLYQSTAKPLACVQCHGKYGDGNGPMASMFEPSPRNFTCSEVVSGIPDGQFFWIIKNGSIGTSMPAFNKLTDHEIWQLTLYLRSLERKPVPDEGSESSAAAIEHASL